MADRSDLRQITQSIADALAGHEPDALLAMLTHLFREYVVDGPPPMMIHQAERIADLEGLSFAGLITALQTRLDVPELSLFQVDGEQVSVRIGGVLTPLAAPRGGAGLPEPAPRASGVTVEETALPPAPGAPAARPSVDEAVARGRGDLAGLGRDGGDPAAPAAARAGEAPPPRRGVSVRGIGGRPADQAGQQTARPSGGAQAGQGTAAAQAASGAASQADQAQARDRAGAQAAEPPGEDDIASTRFSLLELD